MQNNGSNEGHKIELCARARLALAGYIWSFVVGVLDKEKQDHQLGKKRNRTGELLGVIRLWVEAFEPGAGTPLLAQGTKIDGTIRTSLCVFLVFGGQTQLVELV